MFGTYRHHPLLVDAHTPQSPLCILVRGILVFVACFVNIQILFHFHRLFFRPFFLLALGSLAALLALVFVLKRKSGEKLTPEDTGAPQETQRTRIIVLIAYLAQLSLVVPVIMFFAGMSGMGCDAGCTNIA
jgi:4-amino-4-deoxy-L-arabinose transferase-like glycosyltransferase